MRTQLSWSMDYLNRRHGAPRRVREWECAKCRELTDQFHTPFCCYHARGRVNFLPYLDYKAVQAVDAPTMERQMWEALPTSGSLKMASFWSLHKELGWPLDQILPVAKSLAEGQLAKLKITRSGYICFIARSREVPDWSPDTYAMIGGKVL